MEKTLLRILAKLNLLSYFNFTISHSRNGKKVFVPIIKSHGSENLHLSEMWMCEVLSRLLALKDGLFIDVGVNVGQTLIKLKLVNSDVPYIGFDPNPICIFYTKELIELNGFSNTRLVPVGISDKDEIVTLFFYTDGDSDSSASIVKDFRPQKVYRQEYVGCFGADHLQPVLLAESISIVKIDVEGAELQVLKGIRPLLAGKRPFVLIEILPVYTQENVDRLKRQHEIESLVRDLDFRILRLIKSQGQFTHFQPLDSIGISDKIEESDYLLCPAELMNQLLK